MTDFNSLAKLWGPVWKVACSPSGLASRCLRQTTLELETEQPKLAHELSEAIGDEQTLAAQAPTAPGSTPPDMSKVERYWSYLINTQKALGNAAIALNTLADKTFKP